MIFLPWLIIVFGIGVISGCLFERRTHNKIRRMKGWLDPWEQVTPIGFNKTKELYSLDEVLEIDRCARAYGYEAARHNKLLPVFNVFPSNPFIMKDWPNQIKE